MIDISVWMDGFQQALEATFGPRVCFVGLQGSFGRGEATEQSDIDTVVILDVVTMEDIHTYNAMLDTLPHRQQSCGFFAGKGELANWAKADLFQFYYDTIPVYGSLDDLISPIDRENLNTAIKMGACNVYHGCVHNMLHEKNAALLKDLYKAASFVVQAIVFRQTGSYIHKQQQLLAAADHHDRPVIETFLYLKNGGEVALDEMSERLFCWAQKRIADTE